MSRYGEAKASSLTLNDFLRRLTEQNFSLSLELLVFLVHRMHLTQELLIETGQAYLKMKQICNIKHTNNPGLSHILTFIHFGLEST